MKERPSGPAAMEKTLAHVLHYGTWLACILILFGFAVMWLDASRGHRDAASERSQHVIATGIGLFILLPVLRVAVMLVMFLKQRDYRFAGIAAVVLLVILVGYLLGKHAASAG